MTARHSYSLVTAPASEPVTLAEAKLWAKIDNTADDSLLTILITAARQAAEEYLRRSLITQTWKLTLDQAPNSLYNLPEGTYDLPVTSLYSTLNREVELPKGPVQTITSVLTYDLTNTSSTFAASNYFLDTAGARLVLNIGSIWPANMRPRAAAEITYVTGYGDTPSSVPQPIKTGLMIHTAALYEQRGLTSDAVELPPATRQLYNQFRIYGDRL